MKKFLLSVLSLGLFTAATAQTVVFEETFDEITELPMGWQNIDADGDGFTWNIVQIQDANGNPVFTPLLRSASWNGNAGALQPDNWVITPGIDLTSYTTGEIMLNYEIGSVDEDWDAENYTVYVGTSDDPAVLLNSDITFNEPTLDGVNSPTLRNLDISSLAGQVVYVAFRHHETSDQFTIELDNIQVVASTLGVLDVNGNSRPSVVYPNPVNELVNIRLSEGFDTAKTKVTITNVAGQQVGSYDFNAVLNLSKLPAGAYIMSITDGVKTESKKIIKK